MTTKKYISVLLVLVLLMTGTGRFAAFAQTTDSTTTFNDDPIAAMLDSLAMAKYMEKEMIRTSCPKSKYNFSPDSIPVYEDAVYAERLTKLDAQSPFDLSYNKNVRAYIELYTVRKRELVARVVGLSQLYFPMIEQTLDKYNMPLELKYLAIVESALNPTARSRCGATGLWQFMYTTGKMYDMKVTSYVDERSDIYKSTVAACEYMQFLYSMFGDWELSLAAYNSGPGNVNKAIRRSGGKKTYWEIFPYLPKETQGYVPAFIAVNYFMNYTEEHNICPIVARKTFYEVDTVSIKQPITFAQLSTVLDIPVEDIQYLNPRYKKNFIPAPFDGTPYTLCLPSGKIGSFITNEQAIYDYLKKDTLSSQSILASQEVMKTHTVKKGEHINIIANRYKCTVYDIRTWNSLSSNALKPGQKLTVYIKKSDAKPSLTTPVIADKNVNAAPAEEGDPTKLKYYTIRSGDTLWDIAKVNGTTVENIKRLNNFGQYFKLNPGDKIKVGYGG